MSFPHDNYKILQKAVFAEGNYSIVPIRFKDRMDIMKWRNEQIYHLRQNKPLTEADQNHYFENVVARLFEQEQPSQILFSYLEGDKCIGYGGLVHISWIDKNAEISFIMDTQLEKEHFYFHWKTYLGLLEQVAFEELGLHKIYTYAFDLRPHLYEAVEAAGYEKEALLKEHCLFDSEYKCVIIHSKFNPQQIHYRLANEKDIWKVFELANEAIARANSFNSETISKEEHEKWYFKKINTEGALMIIAEIDNEVAAIIRFDNDEEGSVVGINVDINFRGRGLSSKFLKHAFREFTPQIKKPVRAFIKNDNVASQRVFEKAGYSFKKMDVINNVGCKLYHYE